MNVYFSEHSKRIHRMFLCVTLGLMLIVMSGCASSAPQAVGSYTTEDTQAKNLTPPSGKALVYFFYGRDYLWGNIEIALNGAMSLINKQMYVVWELPAGSYQLNAVLPGRSSVPETANATVNAATGSTSYYRLMAYVEEEDASSKPTLYALVEMENKKEGQTYIDAFSLVSWFRDGQRIYYDDSRLRKPKPVERY